MFYIKGTEYIKNIITNIIKSKKNKMGINNNKNIKRIHYKKRNKNNTIRNKSEIYKKKNNSNANLHPKKDKKRNKRKNNKFETSRGTLDLSLKIKKPINENRITTIHTNINLKNDIAEKFTDYELNSMEYKIAKINDKRTYVKYYFSLLRTKHLLIFAFYPTNDYNYIVIKIILFFFFFCFILYNKCIIF